MLPEFDLLMPKTLPEALEMLAEGAQVAPLAGGTNLIPDMRSGYHSPRVVVNIMGLEELRGIRQWSDRRRDTERSPDRSTRAHYEGSRGGVCKCADPQPGHRGRQSGERGALCRHGPTAARPGCRG